MDDVAPTPTPGPRLVALSNRRALVHLWSMCARREPDRVGSHRDAHDVAAGLPRFGLTRRAHIDHKCTTTRPCLRRLRTTMVGEGQASEPFGRWCHVIHPRLVSRLTAMCIWISDTSFRPCPPSRRALPPPAARPARRNRRRTRRPRCRKEANPLYCRHHRRYHSRGVRTLHV